MASVPTMFWRHRRWISVIESSARDSNGWGACVSQRYTSRTVFHFWTFTTQNSQVPSYSGGGPMGSQSTRRYGSPVFGFFVPAIHFHPPSDRKSTRLNSSHVNSSYTFFSLKNKK